MAGLTIRHVKIVGMSAVVPPTVDENISSPVFADLEEAKKVIASTGIERKRMVTPGTTALDLAEQATNEALVALGWAKESVDCLVYVGISRDFIAPISSAILQGRVGLKEACYCIDLPLGCSGWVFGMSNIASLLSHGDMKRGLLVCSEANSLNRNKRDKTVRPLFGDACVVTALTFDAHCQDVMQFNYGADGRNYKAVWAEFGGVRNPATVACLTEREVESGVWRKGTDMVVNGMDVFAFAIKVPPRSLQELVETFQIDVAKVDYLFLHQSNKYIDERIRRKLNLPEEKVPYCLTDFGNTSGPSIPLTMVVKTAEEMKHRRLDCLACGFGVGLAWGSMHYVIDHLQAVTFSEYIERNG